ncbi:MULTISPECIES: NAD(P)-dependent alcohol dehydrogenase [unclassified Myxococcus]|uniref:NAD(P)-dependent alcohol dehydrogenase n=1 Tax=unclassified Myxococcus TaxID=2648731 RepID=UPI00157B3478|nr:MULTISPECIES: NAD(P)-dependent alcohol dehydrogenase [unclassified Myxococcus]NTX39687.1 NAD(P)-dependent alcohol dehydrogenase [Myxococcus sp. CA033]NTX56304.1 NAD(P)-dependent alcohol dehydrogenase [Myxococcus sp. CA039A]
MKTVTYERFGGPDVLTLSDVAPPAPRAGHLVVRVRAVSINPLDGKIRRGDARLLSGTRFPKTPGLDFAGVVEQVGEGVSGFRVGDDVFGGMGSFKAGYLSEHISVPARVVAKVPRSLDAVQAAAVAVVGLAARTAVRAVARIKEGDHVLLNGASGGLGPYALQLARRAGAHVTAVSGTDGVALAHELGADTVIDYQRDSILASGKTFDAVLDLSARLPFSEARALLEPHGVYVDFEPGPWKLASAAVQNPFRAQKHRFVITQSTTAALEELGRHFDAGELTPGPTQVFELSDHRRAFEVAEKRGLVGKVVIRLGD